MPNYERKREIEGNERKRINRKRYERENNKSFSNNK